jgi:nicotinamide-nucleotide amidase
MNAEIIAVGSEMLTSGKVDTNSLWLTERLNELGVEVTRKTVIGDHRERLAASIRGALVRVPLLLVTGGLGPTEDDVTREAAAAALYRRLQFSPEICAAIETRFARAGRTMAEINRRQAFLIEGAEKLDNPNGTAPGQWIDLPGGMLLLLPGPPGELKPMFEAQCLPRLRDRLPPQSIRTRTYRVAGMPESEVDQRIAPLYKPHTAVATTILAGAGDIQIHLRARCGSAGEAEALVAGLGARIEAELGPRIYSSDGSPLEQVVGALLLQREATVAVAESCTAGLLGARITAAPGASKWFPGGFQVYSREMKARLLGLDQRMMDEHGDASEAVAAAMAEAARVRTGATYGLAITGEAGPESSSPGIPPGAVWIGIAAPEGAQATAFRFSGDRARIRAFAVQNALNLLRLRLIGG